jgi:hypothetical protein
MPTTEPSLNSTTPTPRPTLAQLVADSRRPKKPKTSQLDAHRLELLKIRKAGAPMRAIRDGLAKMDVVVSEEALRLWFNAQRARTDRRRRLVTSATRMAVEAAAVVAPPAGSKVEAAAPTAADEVPMEVATLARVEAPTARVEAPTAPAVTPTAQPADRAVAAEARPGSALPEESIMEKLRRLRAALPPLEPKLPQRGPRIARDDF